jgi:hypothetical protein
VEQSEWSKLLLSKKARRVIFPPFSGPQRELTWLAVGTPFVGSSGDPLLHSVPVHLVLKRDSRGASMSDTLEYWKGILESGKPKNGWNDGNNEVVQFQKSIIRYSIIHSVSSRRRLLCP